MPIISFSHPWILLAALAVPALLAIRLIPKVRERGQVGISTYEWMPSFAKSSGNVKRFAVGLRMCAILSLVPIAAGIQSGKRIQVETERSDALVIVLDISSSMTAEDFTPGNRLEAARSLLSAFSASYANVELGLILLAASPRLVVPITAETSALPQALKNARPAGFGEDGTAIGSGIASAINRLRNGPWSGRRILLVTDGVNNRGALAPADAARLAAEMGIRIDTVGIGTDSISRFWMPTSEGVPVEVRARIQIDDKALEEVSKITGGSYYRVVNSEELNHALESLRLGTPRTISAPAMRDDFSWIQLLALMAVLWICLEFVITRFISPELPG